jgi:N utilization substance protein A
MAVVSEFMAAVNQICAERGIDSEEVFEGLESAILAAYRKDYGESESMKVEIDRDSGEIHVIADKKVVEEVDNKNTEISLEDAHELEPNLEIGDHVEIEMEVEGFGRIAAQTAKHVILQKVREAEKKAIIKEFEDRIGAVVTGLVQRMAGPTAVVEVGKAVAKMPPDEQIPNEFYQIGERYKFFLKEIRNNQELIVSRSGSEFLKELFRLEVPEIESGVVEIKACAREAGSRSKLAVVSHQDGIDPIGSCVGQKGVRIANIMSELGEEKIDIIEWAESIEEFVANALGPAQVENVTVDDEVAKVRVTDEQLSLAIGKDGQNVRLAAKLTGLKIDITSPSLDSQVSAGEKENVKTKSDVDNMDQKDIDVVAEKFLSTRTLSALKKEDVEAADLLSMPIEKIGEVKGIGKVSLEEIEKFKEEVLKNDQNARVKKVKDKEDEREEPSEAEESEDNKEEESSEAEESEDNKEEESNEAAKESEGNKEEEKNEAEESEDNQEEEKKDASEENKEKKEEKERGNGSNDKREDAKGSEEGKSTEKE